MKKFLKEFKEFALKGNVMDLAIGVIIGAAFQAIINSLVKDVISPLIGLVADTDLSYLVFSIGDVDIKYGSFITAVINFIIMAFIIFIIMKQINRITSKFEKKPEVKTKICPYCMSEIDKKATKCKFCTSDVK